MKRKCKCGTVHDFDRFRSFKTTFGGRTTHYQYFCKKLAKLMILTTTTIPTKLAGALCIGRALKKFSKIEVLVDSDEFVDNLYCLAKA